MLHVKTPDEALAIIQSAFSPLDRPPELVPLGAALGVCVVPFLPFDLLKMLAVLAIGPVIRRRLQQARLLA